MACPLCKEALVPSSQNSATTQAAKGYALSIAALLGTPLMLLGGIAFFVVRSRRPHEP